MTIKQLEEKVRSLTEAPPKSKKVDHTHWIKNLESMRDEIIDIRRINDRLETVSLSGFTKSDQSDISKVLDKTENKIARILNKLKSL